jgi:fibronectin type 3 domain-containing protein
MVVDHPLTQTNYTDATVHPGISYFYEVSSVDKSGNESKPAKTDWVLVPKTP